MEVIEDPDKEPTVGFYVVQGRQVSKCKDKKDPSCATKIVEFDEVHPVRCCADKDPGNWAQRRHVVFLLNLMYLKTAIQQLITKLYKSAVMLVAGYVPKRN